MSFSISLGSIESKVEAWSKSKEGQRRINEVISGYRKAGKSRTAAGGIVFGDEDMIQLASEFIDILKAEAGSSGLKDSVLKHFDSLIADPPVQSGTGRDGEDMFCVNIRFADDLKRDSLDNDGYHDYPGVNNIVALFNNGVDAAATTYGLWKKHAPTGAAIIRSTADSAWAKTEPVRPPLQFIQRAVDIFQKKYSNVVGFTVIAIPSSEYEQSPGVYKGQYRANR